MADAKISALTNLTAADPANDMIPIVDVSDTPPASGNTKRISINNLLACSPSATLASATITGALGAAGLNVTGATIPANGVYLGSANKLSFSAASTLGMTLDSTGLGVGGSASARIHAIDSSGICGLFTRAAAPAAALSAAYITAPVSSGFSNSPVYAFWYQNTGISNPANECFAIRTSSTDRLYVDASGNVGIGVTPSTWGGSYKALQLLNVARSIAATGAGSGDLTVAFNAIYDSTDSRWEYAITGDKAGRYSQTGSGNHRWFVSNTTGTAGNEITDFASPAMTLDASGRLLVGTTSVLASGSTFQNLGSARQVLTLKGDDQTSYTLGVWSASVTGDNLFQYFGTEASLTVRGSISYNRGGGLVAYNTTSDYRAKDIIGPVSNSGSLIDSLKVYVGKMKGATIERPMLIAHEAQEVAPYAVTGTKDEVNADGKPKYQQMDASALVPLLIAEIQSLRARVQTLETR